MCRLLTAAQSQGCIEEVGGLLKEARAAAQAVGAHALTALTAQRLALALSRQQQGVEAEAQLLCAAWALAQNGDGAAPVLQPAVIGAAAQHGGSCLQGGVTGHLLLTAHQQMVQAELSVAAGASDLGLGDSLGAAEQLQSHWQRAFSGRGAGACGGALETKHGQPSLQVTGGGGGALEGHVAHMRDCGLLQAAQAAVAGGQAGAAEAALGHVQLGVGWAGDSCQTIGVGSDMWSCSCEACSCSLQGEGDGPPWWLQVATLPGTLCCTLPAGTECGQRPVQLTGVRDVAGMGGHAGLQAQHLLLQEHVAVLQQGSAWLAPSQSLAVVGLQLPPASSYQLEVGSCLAAGPAEVGGRSKGAGAAKSKQAVQAQPKGGAAEGRGGKVPISDRQGDASSCKDASKQATQASLAGRLQRLLPALLLCWQLPAVSSQV